MTKIARIDRSHLGLHGPHVVGATPGRPFLYRIPATGKGSLRYEARNLPEGLFLDSKTGIISGLPAKEGKTRIEIAARGSQGEARRSLIIMAGKGKLALTPPLGWNSWNVWLLEVNGDRIKQAADGLIKTGLADYGYQYVNIDDGWEDKRDAGGEIRPNEKFGDMKALAEYVHAKGLKIGIYSSPGPATCGGFEGSYGHEEQDAMTYAKWGFDYLKYDYCSYRDLIQDSLLEQMQEPYFKMRDALEKTGRDIVYSLCQYGLKNVWEWGARVGGNLWRTSGDITDTWESMSENGFEKSGSPDYGGPGHWNDPDMMVLGTLMCGKPLHPTRLTPDEQITHMTLWSLLPAPILLGCDLSQLDDFTLDLLTNDEVLDVNQDPLGRPARRVKKEGLLEVWARPLDDGTVAAGLFNRGIETRKISAEFDAFGLSGVQPLRDLWQQQDLGIFEKTFSAEVPPHGAMLVKIGKSAPRI